MEKDSQLIHTKLHPPYRRSGIVSRQRLVEKVAEGLRGPLTLVTAPAGFGKTTLVASCIDGCGLPAAWLSLEKEDNQGERFLLYLVAALQQIDPEIEQAIENLSTGLQQTPPEVLLINLINHLDSTGRDIVLVLDDYQFITNQAVHDELIFLLDHCPKTFHLVLSSRSDPPLPISRFRARSQVVELRARDLRFTEMEATQFLNDVMRLHLSNDQVTALAERTEGWVVGLQMASIALQSYLSLREHEDIDGFFEGFSGTNRYILDYLMEEVLGNQPPDIQQFLLCTSILSRFNSPLCDALDAFNVTTNISPDFRGTQWEMFPDRKSVSILKYLDQANLFLVPLDDQRIWYRYHHLFGDLLRARLIATGMPEVKSLHLRAAEWFEKNGYPEDAIQHAFAAQDYPFAARLIEDIAETVWLRAEYSSLVTWIRALPADIVQDRPRLCIWYAWSLSQIGLVEETITWIDNTERAIQKTSVNSPELMTSSSQNNSLGYDIATLRALIACLAEDYDLSHQYTSWVLENPPPHDKRSSQVARCHVLHGLSSLYYVAGELSNAEETSLETIRASKEIGFTLRQIHGANKLAHIYLTRGELHRSYRFLQDILSYFEQKGLGHYTVLQILRCRSAELLFEWNRMAEFDRLVEENNFSGPVSDVPYVSVDLYNIQACCLLAKGDYPGAQRAVDQAVNLIKQSYIWPALTRKTEALQLALWLKLGDLSSAVAWANSPLEKNAERFSFVRESRLIAQVRIFLAQAEWDEAVGLLDRVRTDAEAGGRQGSLVKIRVLEAVALQAAGQPNVALAALEAALAFAETEGYIRTFIDEGQSVRFLLAQWLAQARRGSRWTYASHLLSLFGLESNSGSPARNQVSPSAPVAINLGHALADPLSPRELEVLQLIALGSTNQEIAHQLILSAGTVKAHTANIYRKLDVKNRTEAVAHARQLGFIP